MGTTTKPAHELFETALVQEHLRKAGHMVAVSSEQDFLDAMATAMSPDSPLVFDSPFEAVFRIWWDAFRRTDRFCGGLGLLEHEKVVLTGGATYVIDFVVTPGYAEAFHNHVALERFDQLVAQWPRIGIELDGHAFHEKTKAQVEHRNQRDRALQQAGWHIFHFSFSEFTTDPEAALSEVIDFARLAERDIWRQLQAEHAATVKRASGETN